MVQAYYEKTINLVDDLDALIILYKSGSEVRLDVVLPADDQGFVPKEILDLVGDKQVFLCNEPFAGDWGFPEGDSVSMYRVVSRPIPQGDLKVPKFYNLEALESVIKLILNELSYIKSGGREDSGISIYDIISTVANTVEKKLNEDG